MGKLIASPIELGFTEFVSKLISDTFEAVIASSITQEENWSNLEKLMSLEPAEFAQQVVTDDAVTEELINLFPNKEGDGTLIVKGAEYTKENPKTGQPEVPPIFQTLGYRPRRRTLSQRDVDAIRQIVREKLAEEQFALIGEIYSRGKTKIIVDTGRINAKLNFQIMQLEESDDEEETEPTPTGDPPSIPSNLNTGLFLNNLYPVLSSIQRPKTLDKIRLFVKPPTDKDPQTHQIKANVYGEVEIHFKTIS